MTMANGSPHDISGLPSPDPAASEGNSSVQVNFDSASNRGRSIGRQSRSPSMQPSPSRGQSLARQATANSLSSYLSSQPSSQPSQNDQPPPEDLLRGLIDATEPTDDAANSLLHGVKRPHDDEATDEPLAKRDKLGEELERMSAAHPAPASIAVASGSPTLSTRTPTPSAVPINAATAPGPGEPTVTLGTRGRLPVRRRPPHLSIGTPISRSAIPEGNEKTGSSDDESGHSSDGRRRRGHA